MIDPEGLALAEKQVIGAILTGGKEAELLFALLTAEDFSHPAHREIFAAAKGEFDATGRYDWANLLTLAAARKALDDTDYMVRFGEVAPFAKQVKGYSRERRLKNQVASLLQDGLDAGGLLLALQKLVEQQAAQAGGGYQSLPQSQMEQVLEEMEGLRQVKAVQTGIKSLDLTTGGLRQGNVSTWGAKPSTGKTALLLNVLLYNAKLGKKAAFFSLEMSAAQLWERILANACDVDYGAIHHRRLSEAQKRAYRNKLTQLAQGGNILLLDDVCTVEEQAGALYELRPDFVVVDYIQLVRTMQKCPSRNEEIGYIMARYKQLARKLDCHISLLSQFNRSGTAGREDGLSMFQLKDSGSIEDGSDYVFLLSRPAVDDPLEPAETARIKLQKNKFGLTGVCSLHFDGAHQRFTGVSGRQDRPWPERADRDES